MQFSLVLYLVLDFRFLILCLARTLAVYATCRRLLTLLLRLQFVQSNLHLLFQVLRPPLRYSFVPHTAGIPNKHRPHHSIVSHGIDRMIGT